MSKIALGAVSFMLLATGVGSSNLNASNLANINKPTVSESKITKPVTKVTTPAKPTPVLVTVASGDTLNGIADEHATTYVRIFNANDTITNPDVIDVGQQLRIPEQAEQLPERELPAAVEAPAAPVVASSTQTVSTRRPTVSTVTYPPVSGNDAKAFIYAHESGNNPNATNPAGCYGLGQDCNGRVRALCGADYTCQDAFFTNYALSRYGSWEGALAFWQAHNWW